MPKFGHLSIYLICTCKCKCATLNLYYTLPQGLIKLDDPALDPFWMRIIYMILSFYCKKVIFGVKTLQKASKDKGNNIEQNSTPVNLLP